MAENNKSIIARIGSGIKEAIRKFLVSLKKNPQIIPILALTVSFLIFSLNLTDISDTTAKIYGKHMGLCAFITMLFSILSYVCLFGAFPKRQKPNIPMIVIAIALFAAIIFADIHYLGRIDAALTRAESPIAIDDTTAYIGVAKKVLRAHIISVIVTVASIILEPVYAKLLKKIKTSVEIEYTSDIDSIDISDEE